MLAQRIPCGPINRIDQVLTDPLCLPATWW